MAHTAVAKKPVECGISALHALGPTGILRRAVLAVTYGPRRSHTKGVSISVISEIVDFGVVNWYMEPADIFLLLLIWFLTNVDWLL